MKQIVLVDQRGKPVLKAGQRIGFVPPKEAKKR